MIIDINKNIFDMTTTAIINPVNCDGYMGKGLALEFKKRYPMNFEMYQMICQEKRLQPGKLLLTNINAFSNPKHIINFPTKNHYKNPSKLEYIQLGLEKLLPLVYDYNMQSIAMPLLGCGLGGLDWKTEVSPLVNTILGNAKFDVYVCRL